MFDYLDWELDARAAAGVERCVRWCAIGCRMLENLRRTVAGVRSLRNLPRPADEPRA